MPARKGLLTPQNNFLDTIARRFDGTHSNFVLGNAQAPNHPIVYCSDGFCELTGFPRAKVMSRNCSCQFLVGPATNQDDAGKITQALDGRQELKIDILLYKSTGLAFWCLLDIVPIKNEKGEVVLFLVSHKDITKEKLADMNATGVLSLLPFLSGYYVRGGRKSEDEPFSKARRRSRAVLYHLSGQFDNKKRHLNTKMHTITGKSSLPEYKVQEAQKSRCIILHYGLFKIAWDWLILLCTFYIAIIVPYNAAFLTLNKASRDIVDDGEKEEEKRTIYSDVIVELLFIADMVLNFRTTFVSKSGQVIYHPQLTALNYIKSWFFLDLLAAIPFDLLYVFQVKMNATVPLLKIARLLRLARLLQKIDRFSQYSAVVLTLLMSMYALISHWMACVWFAIGYHELHKGDEQWRNGWMYTLALHLRLPINRTDVVNGTLEVYNEPTTLSSYVSSLYFTTTVLTSVGFGNVAANTDAEKIFSVVAMMIGALMHAAVFGNVTAIIQRMYARKATYHSKTRDLKDFFRTHHIPKPLKTRMQEFFQTTWSLNNGIDLNDILKEFPEELKSEISMHLYKEILSLGLFDGISPGCMKMLALVVKTTFSAPGETLLTKGDAVHHLYLVCSGSMEILRDELVVAILGKGDLFGCDLNEDELYEQTVVKSGVTARSLTYCMLQCMSVRGIADVMAHYPETAEKLLYDLKQELTFNLREFQVAEDAMSLPLPSISEDEEEAAAAGGHRISSVAQPGSRPRPLLPHGLSQLQDRFNAGQQQQAKDQPVLTSSQSGPQIASGFKKEAPVTNARKLSYDAAQTPKRGLTRAGSRKMSVHAGLKGQRLLEEAVGELRQEFCSLKIAVSDMNAKFDDLAEDIVKMSLTMKQLLALPARAAITLKPSVETQQQAPAIAAVQGRVERPTARLNLEHVHAPYADDMVGESERLLSAPDAKRSTPTAKDVRESLNETLSVPTDHVVMDMEGAD